MGAQVFSGATIHDNVYLWITAAAAVAAKAAAVVAAGLSQSLLWQMNKIVTVHAKTCINAVRTCSRSSN